MNFTRPLAAFFLTLSLIASTRAATLPGVREALVPFVEKHEISGAVTLVVTPAGMIHTDALGVADVASSRAMASDSVFWIASMTKPVTAVAVMMLVEEGKIGVDEPASKYLPELGAMKNADGSKLATAITIKHLMTHTAGLPENTRDETRAAKTLADLVAGFAGKPMQFEPGTKWQYSQTAINSLGRIVEVVSGKRFEDFLDERIFQPLGMKDTTFYPTADQQKRIATPYETKDGELIPATVGAFVGRDLADRNRVPLANGGLYGTAGDYGRFLQMLLNEGTLDGKQYLKPETVKQMSAVQTGELKVGFTPGNGWGLGVCIIREPQGVSASLSPGSWGHGGAYGTQGWIDPVKKVAYVLMVQRSNFPNADASNARQAFQAVAVEAMGKK